MPPTDTKSLLDLIDTTLSLLAQFRSAEHDTPASGNPTNEPDPNPLQILRDAAKLTKAHVTKLSLLAINKPFTPSAIRKVLQELTSSCLPALMSGAQICSQQRKTWGNMMVKEADRRVQSVMEEMQNFLRELQAISRSNGNAASDTGANRNSLSSTGVVWQHCDDIIALETLGVAGLAVQKVISYRDTIKDAIEELEEWKNGEDVDTEGKEALLDSDDEGVDGEEFEDMFHAANSMPKDRPEFASLVDDAIGQLKKVVLLYKALEKRRFKTFRVGDRVGSLERLDQALDRLEMVPHNVDDLAAAFYDLDEDGARKDLVNILAEAKDVASSMNLNWDEQEDPFTGWSAKWAEAVG